MSLCIPLVEMPTRRSTAGLGRAETPTAFQILANVNIERLVTNINSVNRQRSKCSESRYLVESWNGKLDHRLSSATCR